MKRFSKIYKNCLLGTYHFFFVVLGYYYAIHHPADSQLYWFKREYTTHKNWLDFLNVGTDFILFINYPFAKLLQFPFWFGFLFYGAIGFVGILQFKKLAYKILGTEKIVVRNVNVLPFLFYLPNLHYWTANLGKEALCFLWISTILLKLAQQKYRSLVLWLSLFCLFLLRPHVFLMLFFPVLVVYFIYKKWNWKVKVGVSMLGLFVCFLCYYYFLILSRVNSFSWARLQHFNEYSILSFRNSDSYVPILKYTYPEKFFAFFFRPMFLDAYNIFMAVLSIENLVLLIVHLIGFYVIICNFRSFKFLMIEKIIMGFVCIAFLLYIQRYAGLGIFVRTKVMIQPFLMIVLLNSIFKYLTLKREHTHHD